MTQYNMPVEVWNQLSQAERELHDALPLLDGMEECGIECQDYRRMISAAQKRIEAAKRNFPPVNSP